MLNVLEAKIFQYGFLEGHNVWGNNRHWSSTQRNVAATMATKPEFLVAKDENVSCIDDAIGHNLKPWNGF